MSPEQPSIGRVTMPEFRHSVVFADDDPCNLFALERALREDPFELLMTTDPQKALEWIRTRNVGVLVTDQRMPTMEGTTLLRLAWETSPRTARILLTAYPGEAKVLAARELGLLTLFPKPWDDRELRRTIRERLRERELLEGV